MGKFDADRFKTQLKLVKCRLENLQKQHRNSTSGRRGEIANLVRAGYEDRARVNVKYLIRDDYIMEAYEMLLTCCDDLIQSAGLIAREKNLDQDLVPPAKSLLYACGRIEAPELDRLKEQFEAKFGKEFVDVNSEIGKANVDPSLIVKLSIRTPDIKLVNKYLAAIAQMFAVPWKAPEEEAIIDGPLINRETIPSPMIANACDFSAPPPPYSSDLAAVNNPNVLPGDVTGIAAAPSTSPPSTSTLSSTARADTPPPSGSSSGVPDFEELTRRFQALKGDKK